MPLYVALGDLARHLIHLLERSESSEFTALFRAIERLHREGDDYVREAATVGLLEALQNLYHHATTNPDPSRAMLGPRTAQCWAVLSTSGENFFPDQVVGDQDDAFGGTVNA